MEESKLYQSFKTMETTETKETSENKKKLYDDALKRISEVVEKIGELPFNVEEQDQVEPEDDGDGSIYSGSKNEAGQKEGFGIKLYSDGGLFVGN